jgi:hypothetical protein
MLISALVVALSPAFIGAASAQTPFQANVRATHTHNAPPCPNGLYVCGTATITGYGAASWDVNVINFDGIPTPCGSSYTATIEFTLVSDPDSTLVLDEAGSFCGLGHDGAAYRAFFTQKDNAYGHPFSNMASWTVDSTSTGQFSGLTGSGTDSWSGAGAHFAGSYNGTLN